MTQTKQPIYVFGHQNPDTDAIVSAIAYAYLKNRAEDTDRYQAVRLGEINRETQFVLSYFGIEAPPLLPHIRTRVSDVMVRDVVTAHADATVFDVARALHDRKVNRVPLVDDQGLVVGLMGHRELGQAYFADPTREPAEERVSLAQVARVLDARILSGNPEMPLNGRARVAAMRRELVAERIKPGDVVITGDRPDAQMAALNSGASALIITGGVEPDATVLQSAYERHLPLLVTPSHTAVTTRLLDLCVPAARVCRTHPLMVAEDAILSDVADDIMNDSSGAALAVTGERFLKGILTKHDLFQSIQRRCILMDHSESTQSVDGIEEADILEIVDHHRLGGLETSGPIYILVKPVGSSSTLVWWRFCELEVALPREIAGILACAILSDTMLLRSPTTTPDDEVAITGLELALGQDPLELGVKMYQAKTDIEGLSAIELASTDLKSFQFGSNSVGVAQVEVAESETILKRKPEILQAMSQVQSRKGYNLLLLMITDILRSSTEMLAVGHTRIADKAFSTDFSSGSATLPGVMSRKKQVIPRLARVAG